MPSFPLEVVEAIIYHLKDDPPSLCNCSLTCSALLPRSRCHLSRNVQLNGRGQLSALVSAILLWANWWTH
ncbi:hypothetical protein BD309DRAFT_877243 [Dichomitus squalens]|nr:hypothetical protein BD309DRAFT_877243 [Dichomitus squalens]